MDRARPPLSGTVVISDTVVGCPAPACSHRCSPPWRLTGCAAAAGGGAGNGLPSAAPTHRPGQLAVVAGESLWGDVAAQIGGAHVAVTSILRDPAQDPHEYESTVGDAATVAVADVVIVNGAGYDHFVDSLLAANPRSRRTTLTVATVAHVRSGANPHLWYDPDYVRAAAQAIAAEFARRQPAHAADFAAGLRRFLAGEQRVTAVIDHDPARARGHRGGLHRTGSGLPRRAPPACVSARPRPSRWRSRTAATRRPATARTSSRRSPGTPSRPCCSTPRSRTRRRRGSPRSPGAAASRSSASPRPCRPACTSRPGRPTRPPRCCEPSMPDQPPATVVLRDAAVRFGPRTIWGGLDLDVAPGEFLAVLGPNGSGKTTLLKVLLGLLPLHTGTVEVCGRTPRRGSDLVGYVPQQKAFDRDVPLRGRDLVRLGLDGHRWGLGRPKQRRARRRRRRHPRGRRRGLRRRPAGAAVRRRAAAAAHRPGPARRPAGAALRRAAAQPGPAAPAGDERADRPPAPDPSTRRCCS